MPDLNLLCYGRTPYQALLSSTEITGYGISSAWLKATLKKSIGSSFFVHLSLEVTWRKPERRGRGMSERPWGSEATVSCSFLPESWHFWAVLEIEGILSKRVENGTH